LAVCLR